MKRNELFSGYKYEEGFRVSKAELRELFRKIDMKLFANKLNVEGNTVKIPSNRELDCKIKYDIDENYSVSIKISWKNTDERMEKEYSSEEDD